MASAQQIQFSCQNKQKIGQSVDECDDKRIHFAFFNHPQDASLSTPANGPTHLTDSRFACSTGDDKACQRRQLGIQGIYRLLQTDDILITDAAFYTQRGACLVGSQIGTYRKSLCCTHNTSFFMSSVSFK